MSWFYPPLEDALDKKTFNVRQFSPSPTTEAPTVDSYMSFEPRPALPMVMHHSFLDRHGDKAAPPVDGSEISKLSDRESVRYNSGKYLVNWVEDCLRITARALPRPINVLRGTKGVRRICTRDRPREVLADFAFVYGPDVDSDLVAAVFQTKAVGSLEPLFWRGLVAATSLVSYTLTKEVRACAHQFNTRTVMLCDGQTLVCVHFPGIIDPRDSAAVPQIWVVENAQDYGKESMRRVVLTSVCHGLDFKVRKWSWMDV